MNRPIIAITAGDTNGVGYEVILKTLVDPHMVEICTPIVYGNAAIAKHHAHTLDDELHNIQWNVIRTVEDAKVGHLNLISCYADNTPLALGTPTKESGEAAYKALRRATDDLKAGLVDAIVTAPICKDNIQSEAFNYAGHTEFFANEFGCDKGSLMMLISEQMRVALVCNHVPIAKVSLFVSTDRILTRLRTLNKALQQDFSIRKPRIAVLGLNPHAGDGGVIGNEEKEVIAPAIEKAKEEGMCVMGPYPADGFFGAGKHRSFDAVLAMYHDQGLVPFKTLDMSGVNYTAGLPIVRTSPDHGTAFEIAGKNMADATSMRHALYMAVDVLKERKQNQELEANQLIIIPEERPRPERREFFPPKAKDE